MANARNWKCGTALGKGLVLAALAWGVAGCDGPIVAPLPTPTPPPATPIPTVPPAGRLAQAAPAAAITHVTASGWRTEIFNGAVTIRPPAITPDNNFRYVSTGTAESLGGQAIRNWPGNRRSLVLPGGAKITMHSSGTQITRVSIYDGDESHEIDAPAQAIRHSQVNAATAATRERDELDGQTGHLAALQFGNAAVDLLLFTDLYGQSGADGTIQPEVHAIQPLARQIAGSIVSYGALTHTFPTETATACGTAPVGGLTVNGDATLTYVSRSGEYRVGINGHTITVTYRNPSVHKWEVWGDPHENLNGKHIKDWEITRRTLLLPDGTKITMHADGGQGVVHTTSIYDGPRSHRITNDGNAITHSCVASAEAQSRDAAEFDGETAYLTILRTTTSPIGALFAVNYYDEVEGTGGTFVRTYTFELMGQTGEPESNPNQVNDYYDDPRLGHT